MKRVFLIFVISSLVYSMFSCKQKVQQDKSINESFSPDTVREAYLHAWNGYKAYAWGFDVLKPLSKKGSNWYGPSFYMTPVDAYDGLLIMGLDKEARECKKLILDSLSFNIDVDIQAFEFNIRFVGALLSAFELDGDSAFLKLAVDLGTRMLPIFDSPTGMPYRYVNLVSGKTSGEISNPAEIGTFTLEFGTLTKYTGNPVFYEKARRAVFALNMRKSDIGLVGTSINVESGEWTNTESHISGMIDSYYEYLLKAAILFEDDELFALWKQSFASIDKYLADSCETGLWYGHADMNTGRRGLTHFGALDAFFPAVLALDGKMESAAALQESCYKMWMKAGIEPEQINYRSMEVVSPYYILRPENIESMYYLYHYTGNKHYRRMAAACFENLNKYCRTNVAYTALKNVETKEQADDMESFFFAETLKYFYLISMPKESFDFDAVIFNTEAHPLKKSKKS